MMQFIFFIFLSIVSVIIHCVVVGVDEFIFCVTERTSTKSIYIFIYSIQSSHLCRIEVLVASIRHVALCHLSAMGIDIACE